MRPVVRRVLLRGHALTTWEAHRNSEYFGLPHRRFVVVPWPLVRLDDVLPTYDGRVGVVASGRAACDWPSVFRIADGESWPLTVVCSRDDESEVSRLNHGRRATVLSEVPQDVHQRLVESAQVYLLSLRELEVSSGHIRLSGAARGGTPVVATRVAGLGEYLEHGETALTFEPGHINEARKAIASILSDVQLAEHLRRGAFERARSWPTAAYIAGLQRMIDDAVSEARIA